MWKMLGEYFVLRTAKASDGSFFPSRSREQGDVKIRLANLQGGCQLLPELLTFVGGDELDLDALIPADYRSIAWRSIHRKHFPEQFFRALISFDSFALMYGVPVGNLPTQCDSSNIKRLIHKHEISS